MRRGLQPQRCAWQHPLSVISDVAVLNGKLATLEWQDTPLLCNPDGKKVKYIICYRKKKITGATKFRISRTILFTPCDGC